MVLRQLLGIWRDLRYIRWAPRWCRGVARVRLLRQTLSAGRRIGPSCWPSGRAWCSCSTCRRVREPAPVLLLAQAGPHPSWLQDQLEARIKTRQADVMETERALITAAESLVKLQAKRRETYVKNQVCRWWWRLQAHPLALPEAVCCSRESWRPLQRGPIQQCRHARPRPWSRRCGAASCGLARLPGRHLRCPAQVIADTENTLVEQAGPSIQEMFREYRRSRQARPPASAAEPAPAEPGGKGV